MYRNPSTYDFAVILVMTGVVAYTIARDRLSTEQTPVEAAKEAFAAGEIDESEFERRLEFHLDDRNDELRVVVEQVNGVGPATSEAIAREYESLDELRASDRERLEGVSGVGEQTAGAVLELVRE
ncbi:helix-hairpin-helix domain-containing protein [Natronorubrum texcoconense]|uniref:Helix-hairpin-helix domain-containing protein n=1 Tax=Natronorubrum texcoconense TaxID=1095776 RepID=A0A1G9H8Q0_9EURY|nr:helix-hairpin-helix domain-containing protein [Natronorubrum texcoconense]SDL09269.1 Helix-hairpin-helix domain-containing protein [Natronorubrum texcoconense]